MVYIIRKADQTIKTFQTRDDDTFLDPGEVIEPSPLSFSEYAERLVLSLDGRSGETVIVPAEVKELTVHVSCPGEQSVDLLINGTPETVSLTKGIGSIILSADAPGLFIIKPADQTKYCPAGQATLYIEVQ